MSTKVSRPLPRIILDALHGTYRTPPRSLRAVRLSHHFAMIHHLRWRIIMLSLSASDRSAPNPSGTPRGVSPLDGALLAIDSLLICRFVHSLLKPLRLCLRISLAACSFRRIPLIRWAKISLHYEESTTLSPPPRTHTLPLCVQQPLQAKVIQAKLSDQPSCPALYFCLEWCKTKITLLRKGLDDTCFATYVN